MYFVPLYLAKMEDQLSPNQVLATLSKHDGPILTAQAFPSISFVKVKSALDSLKSREMIIHSQVEREEVILTGEGEGIAEQGSHEAKVFEAVRAAVDGLKIDDLPVRWLDCMPGQSGSSMNLTN